MEHAPFLLAIGLLAALAPAQASDCATWTTSETDADAAGYYVINDCWHNDCAKAFFSIWVYEEANGIPGLQRGDEVVNDTCHGQIQADKIIL